MHFTCSNCGSAINIPDEKLPQASRFKVKCPHCKELVVLDKEAAQASGAGRAARQRGQQLQEQDGLLNKSLEPEIFPPGAKIFFHLINNADWRDEAQAFFAQMGFHESTAASVEEARMKIRLNDYHLLLLDDTPECDAVLQEISQWPGVRRRTLNIVLLGSKSASLDPITAFTKGINTYINANDLDRAEELLGMALKSYDDYYRYLFQASE